jgi:hypothetical protein
VFTHDPNTEKTTGWWLNWENVCDVASKFGVQTAPFIGDMTLEEATEMVRQGFNTRLGDGAGQAEGLIGRPAETLFDRKGHRLITKLKTKDFAVRKLVEATV